MIPTAFGANFDVVGGEATLRASDSLEIIAGHDAAATCRETRAKHKQHLDESVRFTDRASVTARDPAVKRISHEFALSVAYLCPGCLACFVGKNGGLAHESVVDNPGTIGFWLRSTVQHARAPTRWGLTGKTSAVAFAMGIP